VYHFARNHYQEKSANGKNIKIATIRQKKSWIFRACFASVEKRTVKVKNSRIAEKRMFFSNDYKTFNDHSEYYWLAFKPSPKKLILCSRNLNGGEWISDQISWLYGLSKYTETQQRIFKLIINSVRFSSVPSLSFINGSQFEKCAQGE